MTDTVDAVDSPDTPAVATAAVLFLRLVQVALGLVAAIAVLGPLLGGMNVIAFAALGVFALVCLGFVGVVQIVVNAIRGRWG